MTYYKIVMFEPGIRHEWDVVTKEFKTKKDARDFLYKCTGKLKHALHDGRVMIIKQTRKDK